MNEITVYHGSTEKVEIQFVDLDENIWISDRDSM